MATKWKLSKWDIEMILDSDSDRHSTEDNISLESNSDTDSDKEVDVTDTNCTELTYLTHNWLTVPIVHRLAVGANGLQWQEAPYTTKDSTPLSISML
jgi:hypothetical protein